MELPLTPREPRLRHAFWLVPSCVFFLICSVIFSLEPEESQT